MGVDARGIPLGTERVWFAGGRCGTTATSIVRDIRLERMSRHGEAFKYSDDLGPWLRVVGCDFDSVTYCGALGVPYAEPPTHCEIIKTLVVWVGAHEA